MDMLKGGIGLQAFAEKDPRIAYKREGFRYFNEMMQRLEDREKTIFDEVDEAEKALQDGRSEEAIACLIRARALRAAVQKVV